MIKQTKKPAQSKLSLTQKKSVKQLPLVAVLLDFEGKKSGTLSLPKEVFGVPMQTALMSQAMRVHLANKRQTSALVKTRGDVTGSRRKIWRQKGTGRARHGDRYAPIFVGGGVAHGPKKRDFGLKLPLLMRKKALAMSLTEKNSEGNIIFVSNFDSVKQKTKAFITMTKNLGCPVIKGKIQKSTLFIIEKSNKELYRASKNIKNIKLETASLVATYDVMRYRTIIIEKNAVDRLKKRILI